MWKFLLPFAAFVALAVLFAFGLNPKRDIHALPSPLIGKPAPEFALTDVLDRHYPGDVVDLVWIDRGGQQRTGKATLSTGD